MRLKQRGPRPTLPDEERDALIKRGRELSEIIKSEVADYISTMARLDKERAVIIYRLSREGHLTGQQIAKAFGVYRAVITKAIGKIKKEVEG